MKVGFLILNGRASGWQIESIRELASRQGIEAHILDIRCDRPVRSQASLLRWATVWLVRLAKSIEHWLFLRSVRSSPVLAQFLERQDIRMAAVDSRMELAGASVDAQGVLVLGAGGLQSVAELSLDVLVSFLELPCCRELNQLPRFGMWEFHYSDGAAVRRDLPVGFWEVYFGIRRTMVALEKVTSDPLARWVLRRGWYQTEESSWSWNQLCALEYSRLMLADALNQLLRTGTPSQAEFDNLDSAEQPETRTPGASGYWICLVKLAARRLVGMCLHRLFWEQWHLLVGRCSQPLAVQPATLKPFASASRVWWADPFLFSQEGRTWVFAEEKLEQRAHADICVFEWTGENLVRHGTALSPGYHVSYPFVFSHNADVFMIPESSASGTIELWECVDFPLKWRKRRVMLDGLRAADSTLLQHGGRWWLFTNVSRSQLIPNLCIELFVYSTDDPVDGEWLPHTANPIVTDCRRSRMAGPFIKTGVDAPVFRVCQSNSRIYGESIVVCRIDRLSQTEYSESLIRVFEPDWDPHVVGMHHLCSDGELVIMDAKRRVLRAWH